MNRTDTQAQLDSLRNGLEPDRRRRLTWGAGALAAAAAVVAAVVLASTLGDDSPTSGTDPAEPPRVVEPVDVASGFMEAFAAYDEDRVASYLADGATFQFWWTPPEAWSLDAEIGWSEAAGVEMLPGSCEERSTSADGTAVVCPFDFHALGSSELDRGPFEDNEFSFTIMDGEIVAADTESPSCTNGFSQQMWCRSRAGSPRPIRTTPRRCTRTGRGRTSRPRTTGPTSCGRGTYLATSRPSRPAPQTECLVVRDHGGTAGLRHLVNYRITRIVPWAPRSASTMTWQTNG